MQNFLFGQITEMVRKLMDDLKAFFRQEMELARKEMQEKISRFAQNAVMLAIGGFLAAAGVVVFLLGLGLLIAFAFQTLGLNAVFATFIGLAIVGVIVIGIGAGMIWKGARTIAAEKLIPERAIEPIKHLEREALGGSMPLPQPPKKADPRTPEELERAAMKTGKRIAEEKQELKRLLSWRQMKAAAVKHVKNHPLTWGLVALGGALAGGFFIRRKFSKA